MKFEIPNTPIAQQRPRLSKWGVYNPNSKQKESAKWIVAEQMVSEGYIKAADGPIEVNLTFHMPIAKNSRRRAENALEGQWCCKGKDIDNLAKFALDVLNKIAYEDDRLVSKLTCEKIYSQQPRVEIEVNPLKGRKA